MITVLTYVALIAGGLLILMLLLSIFSGLDLDLDLDFGDVEVDGGGGLGIFKGVLTFVSIGAWTVRIVLISQLDPVIAFTIGVAAGGVAVYLLSLFLNFLLSQQENVNWSEQDALLQPGKVYLKIPPNGEGIVKVDLKGTYRELRARATEGQEIPTGASVLVEDVQSDGIVVVSPSEE
jgi:membrane protein implicated in regulation of membrane protease activity